MKKIILAILLLNTNIATAGWFSAEGVLRITSDRKGATIYIDGEKKGIIGDGVTSITVEEGDHQVRVYDNDGEWDYEGIENTFVAEDSSIEINIGTTKLIPLREKPLIETTGIDTSLLRSRNPRLVSDEPIKAAYVRMLLSNELLVANKNREHDKFDIPSYADVEKEYSELVKEISSLSPAEYENREPGIFRWFLYHVPNIQVVGKSQDEIISTIQNLDNIRNTQYVEIIYITKTNHTIRSYNFTDEKERLLKRPEWTKTSDSSAEFIYNSITKALREGSHGSISPEDHDSISPEDCALILTDQVVCAYDGGYEKEVKDIILISRGEFILDSLVSGTKLNPHNIKESSQTIIFEDKNTEHLWTFFHNFH